MTPGQVMTDLGLIFVGSFALIVGFRNFLTWIQRVADA